MKAILIAAALTLSGCQITTERLITDREFAAYLDRYYTRAEADAINAEVACRQMARTLVQVSRCGIRR